MKILNEKGKLFGIINIIDLIVLVLIVALAFAGWSKYKSSSANSANTNITEATIRVKIPLVSSDMANAFKIGDKLVSGDSFTQSYIEDIVIKDGEYSASSSEGKLIISKHPTKKDIYLTLHGYVKLNGATIKLDKQTVRVGKNFYVKTQTVELVGTVIGVDLLNK